MIGWSDFLGKNSIEDGFSIVLGENDHGMHHHGLIFYFD